MCTCAYRAQSRVACVVTVTVHLHILQACVPSHTSNSTCKPLIAGLLQSTCFSISQQNCEQKTERWRVSGAVPTTYVHVRSAVIPVAFQHAASRLAEAPRTGSAKRGGIKVPSGPEECDDVVGFAHVSIHWIAACDLSRVGLGGCRTGPVGLLRPGAKASCAQCFPNAAALSLSPNHPAAAVTGEPC